MNDERRAAGLAAAARGLRGELLEIGERIAARGAVEVLAPAAPSTVMLELETALGEFCLSEVAVTTCTVRAAGSEGWGAVLGLDREAALAAALADAAAPDEADELGERALALEVEARERRRERIATTRVLLG